MKKVGLLTMPLIDNYGGIIQIAALYWFISQNGYKPYLIDKKYSLPFYKVFFKKILEYNPFYKIYDFNNYTSRRLYLEDINYFIESFFINKTKPIYNLSKLKANTNQFETIIVGSDQVWRYNYVKKDLGIYFLNFVNFNQRKVSYAASFGTNFWEGNKNSIDTVSKLINNFNAISVREDSGVNICKNTFGTKEVEHVLDPTFLADISFYESIINSEKNENKIQLFNYVLDSTKDIELILDLVSKHLDMDICKIDLQEKMEKKSKKKSIPSWLYNFKNAEYIVTDSFHGMVFSIIFNKPFLVVVNKKRGATRFTSLLNQLNLQDRLVIDYKHEKIIEILKKDIDYLSVNKRLIELKLKSSSFLFNNI